MPTLELGDVVETPFGDAVVVEINNPCDTFITANLTTGICLTWDQHEVEEVAQPDPQDREALERWLHIAAVIVPTVNVETDTVRCSQRDCSCEHCYRIIKRLSGRGMQPRTEVTHCRDTEICRCNVLDHYQLTLQDCACMETVDRRWRP